MTDDDDELDPFLARVAVRWGLLACAAFAVCTGWAVVAAPGPTTRPGAAPVAVPVVAPVVVAGAVTTVASEAREVEASPGFGSRSTEMAARRLPGLLTLQLGFFRKELMDRIALGDVLHGTPAVKLVNLWATWCAPCIRENHKFRALSAGWQREVRFVPIHVGAISDPTTYRSRVDEMPATASPLVDASGDAVQNLLRGEELLAKMEGIPITLVLDCRNELRWIRVGELMDAPELDAVLSRLRAELGSPRCAPPTSQRPPGCGDGACDASAEDCNNCPDDCGCSTPGTVCRTAPNRPTPHCAYPDSAFNESEVP
jgi:thiol-disulfide isomerase/thioredoxin